MESSTPPVESVSSERKKRSYTRTGDKGTTSLFNGEKRLKNDEYICALGDVDELNSFVGLAAEHVNDLSYRCPHAEGRFPHDLHGIWDYLGEIQARLLDIGSAIATPRENASPEQIEKTRFSSEHVKTLEKMIAFIEDYLPPLTSFILPSGGIAAAQLHVCRSVCRRAERSVVSLVQKGSLDSEVAVYLNRLSSYFFSAARFCSACEKRQERQWKAHVVTSVSVELK